MPIQYGIFPTSLKISKLCTFSPTSPRVDVFQIGGPGLLTEVQSFDIFKEVGKMPYWMGMAIWPVPY